MTDLSHASRLTLSAGEERAGVDMQLQYVPLATVSGTVPVIPGTPPALVILSRLGEMAAPEPTSVSRPDPEGRFSFTGVRPGRYMLIARSVLPGTMTPGGSPPTAPAGPVQ